MGSTHIAARKARAKEAQAGHTSARRPKRGLSPSLGALQLQRTLGNQAVGHLIQAKLVVHAPHDAYEQEADRVADSVVRMPGDSTAGPGTAFTSVSAPATTPLARTAVHHTPKFHFSNLPVQRLAKDEDAVAVQTASIQRQETEGEEDEAVQAMPLQRPAEEADEEVARTAAIQRQAEGDEDAPVQARRAGGTRPRVTPDVEARIRSAAGQGQALAAPLRAFFESRLGRDFGQVRVHTGAGADMLNQSLAAQAFTQGENIHFAAGKYVPESESGLHLLAHELTHVVQQGKAAPLNGRARSTETTSGFEDASEVASTAGDGGGGPEARVAQVPEAAPAFDQSSAPIDPGATVVTPTPPDAGRDRAMRGARSGGEGSEQRSRSAAEARGGETKEARGAGGAGAAVLRDAAAKAADVAGDAVKRGEPSGETAAAEVMDLGSAGSSDRAFAAFTQSSASQVAATLPGLGAALGEQVAGEQQAVAETTPALRAQTPGVAEPPDLPSVPPLDAGSVDIGDARTEPNAPAPRVKPHQNAAPPPANTKEARVVDNQSESGFFDWLKNRFLALLQSIVTSDPGLNTSAGETPRVETTGDADPERAARQRDEAEQQVAAKQAATTTSIATNPGQRRIQPVAVDEAESIALAQPPEPIGEVESNADVARYAAMEVPENIRAAADAKLAPLLDKSLAGTRADVTAAGEARDLDKQAAIDTAQADTAELNRSAEARQDEIVSQSRDDVRKKQEQGIEKSRARLAEFQDEAGKEHSGTITSVEDRIAKDADAADAHLAGAEVKADAERLKGEKEAADKKRAFENESKEESWWSRAASAVKSAFKAVTKAIDAVFDQVRKAVKSIIDAAKQFALDLIEAGRKWIVDKLESFRTWLKEKTNQWLKDFPALLAVVNKGIDRVVNVAVATVNAVADDLKAGVKALAEKLNGALDGILKKFQGVLKSAVAIAGALATGDFAEAAKMMFVAACDVLGLPTEKFLGILERAGQAVVTIFNDPIGFVGNLIKGIGKGAVSFGDNILDHLKSGLIGWLTGALGPVRIVMPKDVFSLPGIVSLASQVLGLTWDYVRSKAVNLFGAEAVAGLEKGFEIFQILRKDGLAGVWTYIKGELGNLKELVIDQIQGIIQNEVIKAGIKWIMGLLSPVGAIVKAVMALYEIVMFFVEKASSIVALVDSGIEAVIAIAGGAIGTAAKRVEEGLARTIPLLIGFLASLLGVNDVAKKVQNVIHAVRDKIDKAVDKILVKAKAMVGKVVGKAKTAVGKLVDWWKMRESFTAEDGGKHELYYEGKGDGAKLVVASKKTYVDEFLDEKLKTGQKKLAASAKAILNHMKENAGYLKQQPRNSKEYNQAWTKQKQYANDLAGHLKQMKFEAKLSPTKVTFSNKERPTTVTANPLTSIPGNTTGSKPETMPWDASMSSIGGKYIKGHLLNEKLHGPGDSRNIVPIPTQKNTEMSSEFEEPLKSRIIENHMTANFKARVDYFDYKNAPWRYFPEKIVLTAKFDETTNSHTANPKLLEPIKKTLTMAPPPSAGYINLNEQGKKALTNADVPDSLAAALNSTSTIFKSKTTLMGYLTDKKNADTLIRQYEKIQHRIVLRDGVLMLRVED